MTAKSVYFLVFASLGAFTFALAQPNQAKNKTDNRYCEKASDCVPDDCCHLISAVNKQFAPKCNPSGPCTANCASQFDCGEGEIFCENSKCSVRLKIKHSSIGAARAPAKNQPGTKSTPPQKEEIITFDSPKSDLLKLLERIPVTLDDKEAFRKTVPKDLKKAIKQQRKEIFADPHLVASSNDIAIIRYTYDDGEGNFLIRFTKDNSVQAALNTFEKWGQCTNWNIKNKTVTTSCSGSDGGVYWGADVTYDFANKKAVVKDRPSRK